MNARRLFIRMVLGCLICTAVRAADGPTTGPATGPATRPTTRPHADRALIISIDGLRPDVLLCANAPHIRELLPRSSYTFWCRTVPEAYTLPAHISMLTGVTPQRHGITWNHYIEDSYPQVPTLFELAKRAGLSTGAVTGKMKFVVLNKPGTIDWFHLGNEELEHDVDVAWLAGKMIREHDPSVMFVHFGDVDDAGHHFGWGSKEQSAAVARADEAVGKVLDAWHARRPDDEGVLLVTSDHGGAGREHNKGDNRALFVPWIFVAPGVVPAHDLTLNAGRPIQLQDTAATVVWLLGIDGDASMDGKPVLTALQLPPPATRPTSGPHGE